MLGLGLNLLSSVCARAMATPGSLGSLASTLNLDFKSMMALPSTITFARGTNATYYDSTGKLTYAPNNQLLYSQDFTNGAWVSSGTVTRTSGQTDPTGGTTATKLDLGASSGIYQFAGSKVGNYVFSVWVKGDTAGTIRLSDASGGAFDLNVNVTTTWTRVDTGSRAISGFVSPYINRSTGNLATVYVAFSQFELVTYQTTPSTYVATTSAAYYGARLDYNPATLAPRGLLIEEARTNNIKYSNTLESTGSFWNSLSSSSSITATLNQIVSPTGTTDATLLTYPNNVSGAGTYAVWRHSFSTAANGTYVFSVWLRAGTTTSVWLRLNDNAGNRSLIQCSLTSAWQRFTLTGTTLSTISAISTDIGADGNTGETLAAGTVYAWGAQLELGSFATSYIPTAASPVSRSADDTSMTGTNFSSWYNATAGAVVVSWAYGMATASIPTYASAFSMTTSGAAKQLMQDLGINTWLDGTAYINTGAHIGLVPSKTAFSYANGDNAACLNGGTVVTSSSPLPVTPNEATIGNQTGTSRYINGWVASIVYYPRRLPNATLQSLTS